MRKAAHTPVNNKAIIIIDFLQSRGVSFEMFCFSADTLNFGGGLANFKAWNRTARKSDSSRAELSKESSATEHDSVPSRGWGWELEEREKQ